MTFGDGLEISSSNENIKILLKLWEAIMPQAMTKWLLTIIGPMRVNFPAARGADQTSAAIIGVGVDLCVVLPLAFLATSITDIR